MSKIFAPPVDDFTGKGIACRLDDMQLQSFTSCAEPIDEKNWRVWCSSSTMQGSDGFNICLLEGVPGQMKLTQAVISSGKAAKGVFSIGNLPDGWKPTQVVHIPMPDGSHRIYFWAHCHSQGVVRFLCACSSDGLSYEVIDPHRPCLWHYNDRAANNELLGPAGLTFFCNKKFKKPDNEPECAPGMVCNDATNVYLLPDGTFELFTAVIFPVEENDPRYIAHDNAAGWVRVIERRTSEDGLNWSQGIRVLEPDADDPCDLQFYYLAVNHVPEGRVGMLGRYLVEAQTMDIEWCFSKDGITWERPERGAWLKRTDDLFGTYAPHSMVYHNDCWNLFYTGCNYKHNFKEHYGNRPISDIRLAQIPSLLSRGGEV